MVTNEGGAYIGVLVVFRERQERAAHKAARALAREAEKEEKERMKSLRKIEKEERKAARAKERELNRMQMVCALLGEAGSWWGPVAMVRGRKRG